jgi:hypothetical protein
MAFYTPSFSTPLSRVGHGRPTSTSDLIASLDLGPIAVYTLQSIEQAWERADFGSEPTGCHVAPSQLAPGLGLFTSFAFPPQERIHLEPSLLILPSDMRQAAAVASTLASALPPELQGTLRSLAGSENGWEGIVRRNAFGVTIDGIDAVGLFPTLSRLNHSCTPVRSQPLLSAALTFGAER